MRKAFCAYTKGPPGEKGEPGSAALRDRLVHAETIEDYKAILCTIAVFNLMEYKKPT
jgi:hypothetical protein